jgi:PAS domain S-box-containing protein
MTTETLGFLRTVAATCAGAMTAEEIVNTVPELLEGRTGVIAALSLRTDVSGTTVRARTGAELDTEPDVLAQFVAADRAPLPPPSWRAAGVVRTDVLTFAHDHVVVALNDSGSDDQLDLAMTLIEQAAGRLSAEERLADLAARVDHAQQLANMGDYDWHIQTDTNTWSDHLYRIYGHKPQSFNASYEKFLSLLHPDDRTRITEVHQRAYASGEPYQMIERIVRPDGEVRYLSSNGQVIHDVEGTPVRMRGTCIDITDRVHAEEEAARHATRFRHLVESFPDAILVIDTDDQVVQANASAATLFGGDPVGCRVRELMAGEDISGLDVPGRSLTGDLLRLDVVLARVAADENGTGEAPGDQLVAAFIRDAHPRLEHESMVGKLREVQVRRKQALELNDNVVQGLTAAIMSQVQRHYDDATMYLDRTIASARRLMNDWIEPLDGAELQPGDLLRSKASGLSDPHEILDARRALPKILIVDDNEDIRRLLRIQLETDGRFAVVGEAGDGREGVELAEQLQPDVVLLDLAMPVLDGLEALPLIKSAVHGVRVIVLSGFDERSMRDVAFQAGAVKYVEKGVRMRLPEHIDEVLGRV